jgi:DNA-binding MarR family transcriptional regulator
MLFPRYSPKRTLLYQFHLLEIEDREIRILKIKDYEPSLTLVENVAKDFDVSKKDVTELLEQLKKPHCET